MEPYRTLLPSFMAYCGTCKRVTLHAGAGDDHGCEVGDLCSVCKSLNRPHACQFVNVRYVPAKSSKRKAS